MKKYAIRFAFLIFIVFLAFLASCGEGDVVTIPEGDISAAEDNLRDLIGRCSKNPSDEGCPDFSSSDSGGSSDSNPGGSSSSNGEQSSSGTATSSSSEGQSSSSDTGGSSSSQGGGTPPPTGTGSADDPIVAGSSNEACSNNSGCIGKISEMLGDGNDVFYASATKSGNVNLRCESPRPTSVFYCDATNDIDCSPTTECSNISSGACTLNITVSNNQIFKVKLKITGHGDGTYCRITG